jgi:hypothetical protein
MTLDNKQLSNSLALIKGANEALQRDDLPPQVRARLEKAKEIGEAGLKRQLEDTETPAGHA